MSGAYFVPVAERPDMDRPVVAVVMAGGTGTRLYPASRPARPKQLLSLGGDRSLLAATVERCAFADEVVVLTGDHLADAVASEVPGATVLVEPAARDTGPALVYAAHQLRELLDDPVLVNVPSDHVVGEGFADAARAAADVAVETGGLVTLGVEPDRPATEYGYLVPGADHGRYRDVEVFHEKPDAATAGELVADGARWNAGIFAWTPEALLSAARDSPLADLVAALEADRPEAGFQAVEPASVDTAVMERAEDVHLVPASFPWDDLGAWDALARVLDADGDGNVALGDALTVDAAGNVLASDDKHVSVVGVEDLVVAAFDDRVLVVPRAEAQRVREVVARLREQDLF
jgi:mannose-1-phosphate guanylyltransferase